MVIPSIPFLNSITGKIKAVPVFTLIALYLVSVPNSFGQDTIRTYYDEQSLQIKEVLTKINGKAEGPVWLYDPTGKLILIGHLKNDKRDGAFYDLDPDSGDTLRIIHFRENLREGKALSFHPGGQLSQESTFVNNQLEGEVISYFPDGKIQDKTTFKGNKPDGTSTSFFPNGNPKSKTQFLAGQYHGVSEEYDESGNLLSKITYSKGILNGPEVTYYPDGQLKSQRQFINGALDGTYVLNYPDGKPERRGTYKKGSPEGEMIEYFPNGTIRMKAVYTKGIPIQPILYFHENESLRLRMTMDAQGEKIKEESFYPSGKPFSTVFFKMGIEEGEVKIFHENGIIQEIRNYTKGRLNGERKLFDEKGELIRTEVYEFGNKINK
ncbi:toxin-antitoxin system YwqK family antitoxin [Algoriphagus aquatilis]|uniref:Toxin-antitoxin system YwqK family antitoxin n=1 Tax=Algoriphagus aquatilis TaxID=490186 RepID=A0ABW0BRV5_9BACT